MLDTFLEVFAGVRDIVLSLEDGTSVILNARHITGFHGGPHPEIFFTYRERFYHLSFNPSLRLKETVSDGKNGSRWTNLALAE